MKIKDLKILPRTISRRTIPQSQGRKSMVRGLLFENIGIKQTIFKNTLWLVVSEGIFRFSQFLLIIYTIRILGVTEFGKFVFALTFVSILVILSDFGLSDIITRELSRDKKSEKEYSSVLSLEILLSIGALILMLIGSFFITPDFVIRKVIWILAISVLISNFFFIIYAFLRARQKMEYEAGAKIIQALIMVGMVFFVLLKFPSVENISYGYLFASLATLIFILIFFHFYIQPLKLGFNAKIWQKFFGFSWPLGLAAIFGAVLINIDSVIMGYFGQIAETGWYNAARRIVSFAVIPSTLILMSFYPVLSKFFQESREKFQKVWNYYMESMIILAIPIMAGGFILSSKIINFIYNSDFVPSILAFKILIFIVGVDFISNPYIITLIVSNQQKKYLWINLIGAVTNIALNLILIPIYSLYGAAIASVAAYFVILILGIEFSRRFASAPLFNLKLLKIMIMAIISSLIMFIVITQSAVYNLNIIFIIIIGMLIYFAALFLFYKFLSIFNLSR